MKKWSMIFLFLVIACLMVIHMPLCTSLTFYLDDQEQVAAFLPLHEGDTFQIIYTHSIHLTDVIDKYQITSDGRIKQYETVYEQYGIGMPANAKEDEVFVYQDGKYHIKNMNRFFPSIHLRNGKTVSKHRLVWNDVGEHMVFFNDYFSPGDYLMIQVEDLSIWKMWKGVKMDD